MNKPTANEDEYRKQKRAKELKQKHMKMTKNHIVYVMEIYFCYIILFYILLYVYCLINYVNKKNNSPYLLKRKFPNLQIIQLCVN